MTILRAMVCNLGRMAAASILAAALPVAAQDVATTSRTVTFHGDPAVPDISGIWLGSVIGIPGQPFDPNRGPADGKPGTQWTPWPIPYTPEYQRISDQRIEAAKSGRALGDSSARCLPFGLPRMLVSKFYPDEIVQTPGQTTLFIYSTMPVVIWTDGRGHPANLKKSFNGHSIGTWVGDTLMIDTVGINDISVLDSLRNPHSDKIHLRWSIRRVAPDILHTNVTVHDADALVEPMVNTGVWRRKNEPEWALLDDGSCFENNNTVTDENAEPGFVKF